MSSICVLFFPRGTGRLVDGRLVGVGRGHVSRCVSIADALCSLRDEVSVRFAACGDEYQFLKEMGYRPVRIPSIGYSSTLRDEVDRALFEEKLIRVMGPRVVVSDTHTPAILAARLSGVPVAAIYNLPVVTFFPVLSMLGDKILIPQEQTELPFRVTGEERSKISFIGPVIRTTQQLKTRKELGLDKKKLVLVYAGRETPDREKFLSKVKVSLKKIQDQGEDIKVLIVAPGWRGSKHTSHGFQVKDTVPDLLSYIAASHLAISRAGLTITSEIGSLKTPAILIPVKGDREQENNCRAARNKICRCLDIDTPQKELDQSINTMLQLPTRDQGKKRLEIDGATRAARTILELGQRPIDTYT